MNRNDISRIWLTEDAIFIELNNGLIANEMFKDYHALAQATEDQRKKYTLSHFGIHWPEIDEDLSFQGFFDKR